MAVDMKKSASIAVLGAGAAGLVMGYRLKAAGFENFTIFEKDDAVGGTWKRHNYPGLCCDVHSHIYSYSFDPNPYWSSTFPARDELLAYFTGFAEKHGLMPYVRLRTAVTKADYKEGEGTWTLTFDGRDDTETFDYLVAATGFYNDISIPDMPGRDRFKGVAFHSSEWPEGFDLKGKRVGIVGTAAAAVQIAPAIQPDVAQLSVFQRTPSWIVPRDNHRYTAEQQRAFAESNDAWLQHRDQLYDFNRWFLASVTGDEEKLEELRSTCLAYLAEQVPDPELRAKLTPDYEPGCKRLLVTSDYYRTLIQPNVSLVTDAIAQVDEAGIVTADGGHVDLDVLIWCTGYKMPNYHGPVLTTGVGGRTLKDAWPDIPDAFRSTSVPGFPNYFMVNGPNGIFGHSSAIDSAEISSDYIVRLIQAAQANDIKTMDVKPEALQEFNNDVAQYFKGTTFAGSCTGFYHDEKKRVWFFYPGDHDSMVSDLNSSTLEDYRLERRTHSHPDPVQ